MNRFANIAAAIAFRQNIVRDGAVLSRGWVSEFVWLTVLIRPGAD